MSETKEAFGITSIKQERVELPPHTILRVGDIAVFLDGHETALTDRNLYIGKSVDYIIRRERGLMIDHVLRECEVCYRTVNHKLGDYERVEVGDVIYGIGSEKILVESDDLYVGAAPGILKKLYPASAVYRPETRREIMEGGFGTYRGVNAPLSEKVETLNERVGSW